MIDWATIPAIAEFNFVPPAPPPQRFQRQRTKGWRKPPNTVNVTRPGPLGNPFYPGCGIGYGFFDSNMRPTEYDVRDPRVQVMWFRQRMTDMRDSQPARYAALIDQVRGKNVMCFCGLDEPCHGDVWLEIAND